MDDIFLKSKSGRIKYPKTKSKNIIDKDSVPTSGSTNLVESGGVFSALEEHELDISTLQQDISNLSSTKQSKSDSTLATTSKTVVDAINEVNSAVNGKLGVGDIVNNVTSTATNKALSAKMGKDLQDQITNLNARGRYLSLWNMATGLAMTTPTTSPYYYKAGDFFIVGNVGTGTKYKPTGSSYSATSPSRVVETGDVKVNDTYYYDGSSWALLHGSDVSISFSSIAGDPYSNSNLSNALNAKQDELSSANAGRNVTITEESGVVKINAEGGSGVERSELPEATSDSADLIISGGKFYFKNIYYGLNVTVDNVTNLTDIDRIDQYGSVELLFSADGESYTIPDSSGVSVSGADYTWTKVSDTSGKLVVSNPSGNVSVKVVGEEVQSGETWIINESPNEPQANIDVNINFTSNNKAYNRIYMRNGRYWSSEGIQYLYDTGSDFVYNEDSWTNQAYRTVTFETAPTDDLLIWLQSNAVKQ